MMQEPVDVPESLLGMPYASLDQTAQKVARHVAEKKHIARNLARERTDQTTLGQRAADAVARFGGSWTFIGLFGATMVAWVILNSFILAGSRKSFDPYPYILLNLFLSMLASLQAPLILMSQNRQSAQDRENAEHDYEVNLKAEIEIKMLHEKVDLLRQDQWGQLLELQKEQLKLLGALVEKKIAAG